ncbi:PAS domain-containing protein [Streptomyces avidinii]
MVLRPPPPPTPGPVEAASVLAFARRLPGGSCALDLSGRITFVTAEAADLLGYSVHDLLGVLPWDALPMDTPLADHYRAVAAISRLPRTAQAPPAASPPWARSGHSSGPGHNRPRRSRAGGRRRRDLLRTETADGAFGERKPPLRRVSISR